MRIEHVIVLASELPSESDQLKHRGRAFKGMNLANGFLILEKRSKIGTNKPVDKLRATGSIEVPCGFKRLKDIAKARKSNDENAHI